MVLATWGDVYSAGNTATVVNNPVKWHPGHYYTLIKWNDNPKYMTQVYKELRETPALLGIQIRYEWVDLEPTEGTYNFTPIDQLLAELATQEKRLIILLQLRSFNPKNTLIPDYLKSETYEGGIFAYSSSGSKSHRGYNLKLWNSKVLDRLIALISALGARYNNHPYFEGIGLTETAIGQPITALSSTQIDDYYKNLLSINKELRKHFPNTMTFQFVNYPRSILHSFVSGLSAMGTALGGPDTFLDELELHSIKKNSSKGIYNYYSELSGYVPLTPSVMPPNYVNTRKNGTGRKPTILELFSFAKNNLKANYIFWTRTPGYYPKVLEMLNGLDSTVDPAGGLNATCPKVYFSCIN